jgi:hypothetical protein
MTRPLPVRGESAHPQKMSRRGSNRDGSVFSQKAYSMKPETLAVRKAAHARPLITASGAVT